MELMIQIGLLFLLSRSPFTHFIFQYLQLKSKVYIHLAESAIFCFYKVRGIIQNVCYCLFSTDMNKIFHITCVYM